MSDDRFRLPRADSDYEVFYEYAVTFPTVREATEHMMGMTTSEATDNLERAEVALDRMSHPSRRRRLWLWLTGWLPKVPRER
jgi:hypothetical protein